MSTLSLRLPDSLHEQVKLLAKNDGISINQFISSAVAEKMSALLTEEYLKERDKFLNEHGNGWWVNYCIDKKNKRTRVTK